MENPRIRNFQLEVLSKNWYTLRKATFEFHKKNGEWQPQQRECYDRGNGAVILLYNPSKGAVVLTRQFRAPVFTNGSPDGMLIEACAGLLDLDDPLSCILRETEEETGYKISEARKVFEAYMSPGSVTEKLHFFVGEYSDSQKVNDGGGLEHDQEDIEVLELPFQKALDMVASGEICDGKTIMLLQFAQINRLLF